MTSSRPTPTGGRRGRSWARWQSLCAIVIAIWLFNFFRGEGLTDDQQIARSAVAQNDAMQRQGYADFRAYTCAAQQGIEAEILARQRDSDRQAG